MPIAQQRPWRRLLASYQAPDLGRSLFEIVVTAAPLALVWAGAWLALAYGLWPLALLLAAPAAALLVRLFMIQHDCGHHAFFKSAALNDWIGRAIGVLTLTPYDCWRRTHAIHHATSGNLDRRGIGEVDTLTVDEYRALPPLKRLGYRLYRHPIVLFGLGPSFLFLIHHRWPVAVAREGWRPWVSAMATNAVLAALVAAAIALGAWKALVFVYLPTVLLAASIGVWLFYIQHQFEGAYWARHGEWNATEAALHGSSHYDLPQPLRWITANIGVHHVHHVMSRIPFYRLPEVLRDYPELSGASRLGLRDSLRCVGLSLWDEAGRRLVSFAEARRAAGRGQDWLSTATRLLAARGARTLAPSPNARRAMNPRLSLVLFLVLVLGGGLVLGFLTQPGEWYAELAKPSFNPPGWVFGPAWTLLYILIAVVGWLVWRRERTGWPMRLWWAQLVLNFLWTPVFFGAHQIGLALAIILMLFVTILSFIAAAWAKDRAAAWLFFPYAAWVAFASVLNASLFVLN